MNKYRSKFEATIASQLSKAKVKFEYEKHKFIYFKRVRSGSCKDCSSKEVMQKHLYTPDLYLPELKIFCEVKGIFAPSDRSKMKLMKEQHPDVDIRIVLQRDNFALKKKGVRYSDWCKANNYIYALGEIPKEWLS